MKPEQYRQAINELCASVTHQQESKPIMHERDNIHAVLLLLSGEIHELIKAVEEDGEAFEVAAEIGDLMYLSFVIMELTGINLYDALDLKIQRNWRKYPSNLFQSGDYDEKVKIAKKSWQDQGGDKHFSEDYLDTLADI